MNIHPSALSCFCLATLVTAAEPALPPTLEQSLQALRTYDYGQSTAPLLVLERQVGQLSGEPTRGAIAARLASLLQDSKLTPAARLFVCQQLRLVAGPAELPVLASLLQHNETADPARLALQSMPGPAVTRALLDALAGDGERRRVGILQTLGARRDPTAVTDTLRLLADPLPSVASAAADALGHMGNAAAADALLALKRADIQLALEEARLLCAQRLLAAGPHPLALKLYESLALGSTQATRQLALLAGQVRAEPDRATPLLLAALSSTNATLSRHAAHLTCLVPGEHVTRTLAERLPQLPPFGQQALLMALGDRGDRQAAGAVGSCVASSDAAVRLAALDALARIGTSAQLGLLLDAAAQATGLEKETARQALAASAASGLDENLLTAAGTGTPARQAEAIRALAARQYQPALAALQRAAQNTDPIVQKSAFEALATLAGPDDYANLVHLLAAQAGTPATDAAERAVITTAGRLKPGTARSGPLLAELGQATGAGRCALLRVLSALGGSEAWPAVQAALKDPEATVRETAVRALADWPDLSAAPALLELSSRGETPTHRTLALRGYLRLALEAQADQAALLNQAAQAAATAADKRALLGALTESGQLAGLPLAARWLRDADVGGDAAVAVLNLAARTGKHDPTAAEAAVRQVLSATTDGALKTRAEQALREGWTAAETMAAPYAETVLAARHQEIARGLPTEDRLLVFLDCGVHARAQGSAGVVLRQLNGKAWRFEGVEDRPTQGTIAFDGQHLDFEASGLDSTKAYALGFTWWDGDGGGRKAEVQFRMAAGTAPLTALPTSPLPSGADRKKPDTVQVPVPAAAIQDGRARALFQNRAGPNVVLSELWLVETKPGSPSATQVRQTPAESEPPRAVDLTPFNDGIRVLLVTGIDYPGHKWKLTAPVIRELLEKDPQMKVRIVEDPEALGKANLQQWDVVLLHFQNWEVPGPGEASRNNLRRYVEGGGGLLSVHFACGAWHGEWPEFQNIVGRVWHGSGPGKAQHDPYGKFTVEIADKDHPITRGLGDFETTDELYTCLMGEAPIHLLAHAKSKVDQKYHPQAFVREYGQGRVFLTTLGHDVAAYNGNPAVGELLRRACRWTAGPRQ